GDHVSHPPDQPWLCNTPRHRRIRRCPPVWCERCSDYPSGVAGDAAGDLIGTKLGNYRVDSVLGQGGMSVMYRATDVRLGRKVALKGIGEHLGADAGFRERFVDAASSPPA